MPKVHKTIGQAKDNLDKSIAYIPDRYKAAVGKADWATPAGSDEAESNYGEAVSRAVADRTRQKRVREVSNEEWRSRAKDVGGARIGEGVRKGLGKYTARMGPVLDAMNAASDAAPARVIDWRANITNRLIPVVEAARRAAGKE